MGRLPAGSGEEGEVGQAVDLPDGLFFKFALDDEGASTYKAGDGHPTVVKGDGFNIVLF
jgi:hypothetical protein